jgi:phosphate starvation-inducible PhoH-like protein
MDTNICSFDDEVPEFLTKREKKAKKRFMKEHFKEERKISVKRVNPLTENQEKVFDAFENNQHLFLFGSAGTGKTFLAMYLALSAVERKIESKPIVIIRSVVPSRDIGFLPGTLEEKIQNYEIPYEQICTELTGKPTSYNHYKKNNTIQFTTTTFLRGQTFRDNVIIVDECQNMSDMEINTIMTRIGDGCKVIFCGDYKQTDKMKEVSGISNMIKIVQCIPSFSMIEFKKEDIVRSGLVKEYIMARENLGL